MRGMRATPVERSSPVRTVGNGCRECWVVPSGSSSRGANAPAPGNVSAAARSAASAPGSSSRSLLAAATNAVLVCPAMRLTAAP